MRKSAGFLITAVIFCGIGFILLTNLTSPSSVASKPNNQGVGIDPKPASPALAPASAKPKGFREYPIGDEVEKNALKVAAVWLPGIAMDGSGLAGTDVIHLEADVKSTKGNPNGFADGEFVPYLKIAYEVSPAVGGEPIQKGTMIPMVAGDGLHYGASIAMPKAGAFRLKYRIDPPSAGGLGRHSDPATGVAPWWEPFEATFDWDYEGPPK